MRINVYSQELTPEVQVGAKACDDLPGTCNEYPNCQCGRAWEQHEQRLRAASREGSSP